VPAGDARTRRALARLVARAGRGPVRDVAGHYLQQLLQALGPAPMRTRRGRSPPRSRGRRTGRWSVYVVRCADDSLYTGVAVDVAQRIARHNSGKGARYTRGRGPVRLVYQEHAGSRSAALKRELAVKRLTPAAKRRLIAGRG
jgi:predicted GIY-YIG superfamily endonuclease